MKHIKTKGLIALAILYVALLFPFAALAQNPSPAPSDCNPCPSSGATPSSQTSSSAGRICNPINCDLPAYIKTILTGVIKIGIPVITLAIIYCGFLFVSARGNEKELQVAKRALMYTLIGAAVLLGSWALAQLISDTVLAL
ncbi:MAG: hypothetical protein WDN09_03660 [bacterium]